VYVTIYTDGSFNDRNKKGGWGVYLRSSTEDWTFSGPCSNAVQSSNQAELEAMVEGISRAFSCLGDSLRFITIVADSQSAIRTMRNREMLSSKAGEQFFQRSLSTLLENRRVKVYFKWLHGHHRRPQGSCVEAHISAICDELAYSAMKAA
jgi:ribonuclease HI